MKLNWTHLLDKLSLNTLNLSFNVRISLTELKKHSAGILTSLRTVELWTLWKHNFAACLVRGTQISNQYYCMDKNGILSTLARLVGVDFSNNHMWHGHGCGFDYGCWNVGELHLQLSSHYSIYLEEYTFGKRKISEPVQNEFFPD